MSEEMNYRNSFEELKAIVADLEEGEISVDELSIKVKRATELIRFCREKLRSTEGDVKDILAELEDDNS